MKTDGSDSGFINKITYYSLKPQVQERSWRVSLSDDDDDEEMVGNEHNSYYDSPSNKRKYENMTWNSKEIGEFRSLDN